MKFTTVAAILAFAYAAAAAPQGQEGGDGQQGQHGQGEGDIIIKDYCCPVGVNGYGQGYATLGAAVGCSELRPRGTCTEDWPVSWSCYESPGSSKGPSGQVCFCTASDNCPDSPSYPSLMDALSDLTGAIPALSR
ncbi:hypothetical protein BDV30DRAFT_226966 [Aspergillus minisclerotigenes]|uniref:Uncharacterized protein n=1 Tax=Aspergillus minisclerotigenes TaxID=656917 RepID=A0A5N6J2X4_9EURO|nr:hypothetical protein BDV30DRAFT_226966 [Aspergillus minisclerotigenes]